MKDLRYHTCTADDPWTPESGMRGLHPDAVESGQLEDWYGGSYIRYRCPNCGQRWKQELPQ
jgi:hypothetical protein